MLAIRNGQECYAEWESFGFTEALSSFAEFFAITLSFRAIFFFGFFCVRCAINDLLLLLPRHMRFCGPLIMLPPQLQNYSYSDCHDSGYQAIPHFSVRNPLDVEKQPECPKTGLVQPAVPSAFSSLGFILSHQAAKRRSKMRFEPCLTANPLISQRRIFENRIRNSNFS